MAWITKLFGIKGIKAETSPTGRLKPSQPPEPHRLRRRFPGALTAPPEPVPFNPVDADYSNLEARIVAIEALEGLDPANAANYTTPNGE